MLTVLITGSMGAGKSSVIAFLELKNYPVFKADRQAKEMLKPQSPCHHRLRQLFGENCFSPHRGEFNKKKLAQEIFKDPEKRKAMEALIHPLVQESFKKFVVYQKKKDQNKVFYEAPLISQSLFNSFDKLILLVCSKDIKKRRLMKKGWTEREIEERWALQVPESEIIDKVDFVIDNSGDLKNLHEQIGKNFISYRQRKLCFPCLDL